MREKILEDEIGLYINLYGAFTIRPMIKSNLFENEKVVIKIDEKTDPFIYVYKLKGNIKEWWVHCGFNNTADKAIQYELVKTLYIKQFLQLRT